MPFWRASRSSRSWTSWRTPMHRALGTTSVIKDVEELAGNGINVIAAFNVQHLASLNQMVRRIIGVEIRETVPDTFLSGADQIVSVDISVAELRQRLR
jgi:K+-sensing histidine kinase KdpD